MKGGWVAASVVALVLGAGGRAAPRVLFSNDAVNLLTAPPAGVERGAVPARLQAAIAEAAGADIHLLQPGNGWVPWWRSRQYPAEEHYRWFQSVAAREPDPIGQYLRDGGDLVADFVAASRAAGVSPFVSLRLNDYHGAEAWDVLRAFGRGELRGANVPLGLGAMASQSRVLLERPEWQLKPDPREYAALSSWPEKLAYAAQSSTRFALRTARIWDWARPEVPAYKLGFIRELCGYDLDGLELDFMRWSAFFRVEEVTVEARRAVMLAFIREVRAALDQRSRRDGGRRSLGVRIPSRRSGHAPLGIDLPAWAEAGVDWANLSCHYISEQQTDLAAIHRLVPALPLYLELTFASGGRRTERRTVLDGTEEQAGYRLMTTAQFTTAAHLAYRRGATGISLFNFAYFRNLGPVPATPPFELLAKLKDRAWVARQPQHYFLSLSGNPPSEPSEFARQRRLAAGKTSTFALDLAAPEGGWRESGRLRLELSEPWGGRQVTVRFNGRELESTNDVAEPYADPLATPASAAVLRAWRVPREALREAGNTVEVLLQAGPAAEIRFLDLAVR